MPNFYHENVGLFGQSGIFLFYFLCIVEFFLPFNLFWIKIGRLQVNPHITHSMSISMLKKSTDFSVVCIIAEPAALKFCTRISFL